MPQGDFTALMLFAAFLIFITARGHLGTYIRLLI
jgi:hypothetical protein